MVGEHTVSLVGSYDNIEAAIVAWNNGNTTAQSPDHFELFIEPGIGAGRYHLVKIEIA